MAAKRTYDKSAFNSYYRLVQGMMASTSRAIANASIWGIEPARLPCGLVIGAKGAKMIEDIMASEKSDGHVKSTALFCMRGQYYLHNLYMADGDIRAAFRRNKAIKMFERDDQPSAQMEVVPDGWAVDQAGSLHYTGGWTETAQREGGPLLWVVSLFPSRAGYAVRRYQGQEANDLLDRVRKETTPMTSVMASEHDEHTVCSEGEPLVWDCEWKAASWVENFGHLVASQVELPPPSND